MFSLLPIVIITDRLRFIIWKNEVGDIKRRICLQNTHLTTFLMIYLKMRFIYNLEVYVSLSIVVTSMLSSRWNKISKNKELFIEYICSSNYVLWEQEEFKLIWCVSSKMMFVDEIIWRDFNILNNSCQFHVSSKCSTKYQHKNTWTIKAVMLTFFIKDKNSLGLMSRTVPLRLITLQ